MAQERRNALYSSLYEATHDLGTGGFLDNEAGRLYKSTGNTANPFHYTPKSRTGNSNGSSNNTPTTNGVSQTVQEQTNTRHEEADKERAASKGWDAKTPGYITQGAGPKGKQNWLSKAIGAIARNAEMPDDDNPVATAEGVTHADFHNQKSELLKQESLAAQGRPYYGLGNIDLNSRPTLQNSDGTYSTVDSFSTNINGREVLLPTVINVNGQWQHVDENTAIQHYLTTGEYLGMFDTPQEANNYAQMLHQNQDSFYSTRRGHNPSEQEIQNAYNSYMSTLI